MFTIYTESENFETPKLTQITESYKTKYKNS